MTHSRERILEVSKILFARNGYHGSSIRDIASELRISVSGVYNHYPSKDAILHAVLRRPIVEFKRQVDTELALSQGCTPEERLLRCLRVHYQALIKHKLDAELIESEYLRLSDDARTEIVTLRNEYEAIFKTLVWSCTSHAEQGHFPTVVSIVVNVILGLAGNNHRWFRENGPMSADEMVEFYLRFAMAGARAALQFGEVTDAASE